MNTPLLSVIIPIYNSEKYLSDCLDSILSQTFTNYEIICVDDGSTDNSSNILKEYRQKNKKITVIRQDNSGVNEARIAGYKQARGEYIAWVDSDDIIAPTMFEKMMSKAEECDNDVVICNYDFFPKNIIRKEKWYKPYTGKTDWRFITKNTIQWNKIVKKSLLDSLDITELFRLVGEGCYTFVLIEAKNISTIDEPLYFYRVGHSSLSSNFSDIDWYKKTVIRNSNQLSYAKKRGYSAYWMDYLYFQYLYYNLILLIISAYNNDKSEFKSCRKILRDKKMFSKKNKKYLSEYMSWPKNIFFKYIGINSFTITRLIARKILSR